MKVRKGIVLVLVFVLALLVNGCGSHKETAEESVAEVEETSSEMEAQEAEELEINRRQKITLDGTGYSLIAPEDYKCDTLESGGVDEDITLSYYSDTRSMSFDVYYIGKDEGSTLESIVKAEAAECNATSVKEKEEINEITVGSYCYTEAYDDGICNVVTYVIETEESFIEITFWMPDKSAEIQAEAVIESLEYTAVKEETQTIKLGSAPYSIITSMGFASKELNEEEKADSMVAYYSDEEKGVDFDVYQFSKDGYGDTIADYIDSQAEEHSATEVVAESEINGIETGYFCYTEQEDGEKSYITTYVLQDGDNYIEISFWGSDEAQVSIAQEIMNTLAAQ